MLPSVVRYTSTLDKEALIVFSLNADADSESENGSEKESNSDESEDKISQALQTYLFFSEQLLYSSKLSLLPSFSHSLDITLPPPEIKRV